MTTTPFTRTFSTEKELTDYADRLNEAGLVPEIPVMDSRGISALATLQAPGGDGWGFAYYGVNDPDNGTIMGEVDGGWVRPERIVDELGNASGWDIQWPVVGIVGEPPANPDDDVQTTPPSRDELLAICRDAFVKQENWSDRDSGRAQQQLGQAYALLMAGCDFSVRRDDRETLWVRIEYRGFSWFEGGGDPWEDRDMYLDHDEFYLPTRKRLGQCARKDWY